MENRTWPIVKSWCDQKNKNLFAHRYLILFLAIAGIGTFIALFFQSILGIAIIAVSYFAHSHLAPEEWDAKALSTSDKRVPDDLLKEIAASNDLSDETKKILSSTLRENGKLLFSDLFEIDEHMNERAEVATQKQGEGYKALAAYSERNHIV